jgi:hypothetical protein
MTTTEAVIDAEMDTRLLSVSTDDSPEQTRAVIELTAEQEERIECPVDFDRYHSAQRWIAKHGEKRVVIPFASALAKEFPTTSPRIRRDFITTLCLIRSHAIWHQLRRDKDEHGRVVATPDGDYAPIRFLVGNVIGEAVDVSVPPAIRETVEAVTDLISEQGTNGPGHVTVKAVEKHLGVGQAIYGRVSRALAKGYLINKAAKDERGKKLVVGTPLPGDEEFLPTAEAVLLRFISDRASENENGSTMRSGDAISDPPTPPTKPQVDWDGRPVE